MKKKLRVVEERMRKGGGFGILFCVGLALGVAGCGGGDAPLPNAEMSGAAATPPAVNPLLAGDIDPVAQELLAQYSTKMVQIPATENQVQALYEYFRTFPEPLQ